MMTRSTISHADTIQSFLYFGYCPRVTPDALHRPWLNFERDRSVECATDDDLIAYGAAILEKAIAGYVDPDKTHIVPLSGGYDSRAILGFLLESGVSSSVVTATFGKPRTFDYDIGCYIAQSYGLRHITFDLTKIPLTQDVLEQTARSCKEPIWLFDAFYNRLICNEYKNDAVYWSGYMGDPTAGSHLPELPCDSWETAIQRFIHKERQTSFPLVETGYSPADRFPDTPFCSPSMLTYEEQLDFIFRQEVLIRSIVLPHEYTYRAPFIDPQWVQFSLSLPARHRKNQSLYIQILKKRFPDLFDIPVKAKKGLTLNPDTFKPFGQWCAKPMLNYIDFDAGLRDRDDLKSLVYTNIQDLQQRGVVAWLNIPELWNRHQANQANHGRALTLLASLEIILKVTDADRQSESL